MPSRGVKSGYNRWIYSSTWTGPDKGPVHVPDWAATVYSLIGIDPQRRLVGPGNRPMPINYDGEILKEALA